MKPVEHPLVFLNSCGDLLPALLYFMKLVKVVLERLERLLVDAFASRALRMQIQTDEVLLGQVRHHLQVLALLRARAVIEAILFDLAHVAQLFAKAGVCLLDGVAQG